jgi:orotate phosphoribosyltransferase
MLAKLIHDTCLLRGEFPLRGGKISTYYLDLRKITLSENMKLVARELLRALDSVDYEAIGGPETGANQIVGGYLTYRNTVKLPSEYEKRGFVVRKAEKAHGNPGEIVGTLLMGDHAVLVEDVTTTGESLMAAVRAVRRYGAEVNRVYTVVDQEKGAQELFENNGIQFHAMYRISEILDAG